MPKKEKKAGFVLADLRQVLRDKMDYEQGFTKLMEEQPKLALEQTLGKKLPENVNVHFVENTLDKLYLVLPANPDEISDEQLQFVSGGVKEKILYRMDRGRSWAIKGPPGYEIHCSFVKGKGYTRKLVYIGK